MSVMKLPTPSSDALAASQALRQLICEEIARCGGWISFARYMDLVLYAPRLGYYSGGAAKLGKDGDFTTAPEITPLFGAALARVAAAIITQTAPQILEFGAGTGKLAHDVLTELNACGVRIERYAILELSGELRARQQLALKDFPQVEWLDQMPSAFSGLVLGNEVLDAMPVHLVRRDIASWHEVGVGLEAGSAGQGERPEFRFAARECDAALQEQIAAQIPHAASLPPGYLTEVHPAGCAFMHTLARMLAAGTAAGSAAILVDYGFPAREYYLDQRRQGTLMCHYRHHSHSEPFFLPGLQDITAHVDFTAMAKAANQGGLEVLAYMGQAAFLLAAGIGELLLRTAPSDAARYLPQANAVQKLLSPAEMGELFKVLVVGKGVSLPQQFERGDRSGRL